MRRREGFHRHGATVRLRLDDDDAGLLRHLLAELIELVAAEPGADDDPLAAAVGIGTATTAPDDPVLARLFPDGYADDPDAAGEFRRYTENDLRARKHDNARVAAATLDAPGPTRPLSDAEAQAWLGALNDLRLILGTRLDVDEEDWAIRVASLRDDDPLLPAYVLYDWLTWLQASLVEALVG